MTVVALFTKDGVNIRKQASFEVEIWDDRFGDQAGPQPVQGVDYADWPEEPYDSLEPAADNLLPVPYIQSLTERGLLRIGWDRPLLALEQWPSLPGWKVAVRDWQAMSQRVDDYELKEVEFDFYEIQGRKPAEYVAIVDALDIRITPADSEVLDQPIEFAWKIIGFSD